MRYRRIRPLWLIALLLILAAPSYGQDPYVDYNPEVIWPTYHGDMIRRGINKRATDISNPASLNLIWVFPRADLEDDQAFPNEEYLFIVDNLNNTLFSAAGAWKTAYHREAWANVSAGTGSTPTTETPAPGPTGGYSFYWANAVNREDAEAPGFKGPVAAATWQFPSKLPAGYYQVWVWVPPSPEVDVNDPNSPGHKYTEHAIYTVYDAGGKTNVAFDQSKGGTWQPLSVKPFRFTGLGARRVELTNKTNDNANAITTQNIRVAADAIKFVPSTGQEIYSSPASAEVDFNYVDPKNSTLNWSGRMPVVYTGTVEQPFLRAGNPSDTGAVYCISSITPDTNSLATQDELTDTRKALSKMLGKPMWRYPRDFEKMDAAEVKAFLKEKNSGIEGPIEGGIYSSPTLAHAQLSIGPNADSLMCIVTAMDRQVYGLDAVTGKLLWKGPGVTTSELDTLTSWTAEPAVGSDKLRNDAFGGVYRWVKRGSGDAMTWSFAKASETGTLQQNCSYTVYAWIPIAKGGEPVDNQGRTLRAPDAEYTINYYGGSSQIKINQGAASNQGRWVSLGSYFGVTSASLSIEEKDNSITGRTVVADAMMIVPDTVGAFSYCSPTTDVPLDLEDFNNNGSVATSLFVNTATEGRMICFDLKETLSNSRNGDPIGHVKWVYPRIRDSYKVTPPNGGDQPSMGPVGASPTFFKDPADGKKRVYLPTLGGTIHCVDADTGDQLKTWADAPAAGGDSPEPDEVAQSPGFTSSMNVGKLDSGDPALFIGSVEGTFYAFKPNPLSLAKKYQSNMPLGAFRYSTPSTVARDSSGARVWAPSTDGHIYPLRATAFGSGNFLERIPESNTPGQVFVEPSVLAPIQASPAIDGYRSMGNKDFMTMYVGDMNGILHWFNAMDGTSNWRYNEVDPLNTDTSSPDYENYTGWQCEGALFSSPNVTNFTLPSSSSGSANYIYVGGADGRIYAFSNAGGAWGGEWAGGKWPFQRPPGRGSNAVTRLAPDTDVQADLFNVELYDRSMEKDPNPTNPNTPQQEYLGPGSSLPNPNPWDVDDWIVSKEMKLPNPSSWKGLSGRAKDAAIDKALTEAAYERRKDGFIFPNIADRNAGSNAPIYFEWGETLNVVIWNLPAIEFLQGQTEQSAASSIVFSLANTSPGASAGSLIRQTSRVTLKEYVVLDQNEPLNQGWKSLRYHHGAEADKVRRCYALAQIYLDPKRNPPFSPGPGWTLVVEVKRKRTNNASDPLITQRIPIAKLVQAGKGYKPDFDQEQLFGINNPLAIRDDGDKITRSQYGFMEVGWPDTQLTNAYQVTDNTRKDPEAHFNGNAELTYDANNEPEYRAGKTPFINWQSVSHGSSTREAWLGVMDRSATGTKITSMVAGSPVTPKLDNFRINNPDLSWRGGPAAISKSGGVWLPWEFGPGSTDYPNIYRQRQEFRKASDDGMPAEQRSTLPPVLGSIAAGKSIGSYVGSMMQPETVYASVEVPRFQPANYKTPASAQLGLLESDFVDIGYTRTMDIYLDSNNDGTLDRGNTVVGRPATSQEPYRRFRAGLMVPPDEKIEVEESLVDVGIAPHGLGEGMTGLQGFSPYNPIPAIAQWFKPVTIKNAGNVNMANMRVGNNIGLLSDQSSVISPIPAGEIVSSLDDFDTFFPNFKLSPFKTVVTSGTSPADYGYTLSKAKVGEPDPTTMTVPDKRKWDLDFENARTYAQECWGDTTQLVNGVRQELQTPLPVQVSVRVPLTQPIGTYQSVDGTFGVPFVPVYSDRDRNGILSHTAPDNQGRVTPTESVAQKSFQLKVTVRETQLTGGVTDTSLPHIDAHRPEAQLGDATPAAYRDPASKNVFLAWSSPRVKSLANMGTLSPSDRASAPWFISHATLNWDSGWKPVDQPELQWWQVPAWSDDPKPYLPAFGWPATHLGNYKDWTLLSWNGDSKLPSVRHHSPVFAQYSVANGNNTDEKAWMAWVGTADIQDPNTKKVAQEHLIFYTDASNCNVTSDASKIYAIEHDPAMVKRSPSLAVDPSTRRLWTFWQGGDEGKWGLYCSANDTPADTSAWTSDMRLLVPDDLISVSSPNGLLRHLWNDNRGAAEKLFDVVYSGGSKLGRASDVLLTRYFAKTEKDVAADKKGELPNNKAQPLPRIFGEKLEKDTKFGYYTSRHLAWMRPNLGDAPVADNWGGYDMAAVNPDLPYVRVILPAGYPVPGGTKLSKETAISATDGSVWERSGSSGGWSQLAAPMNIVPRYDEAAGLFIYSYPENSEAHKFLGDMLADFSAGVVRFTERLSEMRDGDKFLSANVHADYTPRTWRFTTDPAVDNSPRAFIERTNMFCDNNPGTVDPNPGLGSDWRGRTNGQPVDRMWLFWRKAATGSQSSTIFFSTYRVGVELSDLFRRSGRPMDPAAKYKITSVEGSLGPWEIDGTGTKVFFTEIDERYRSLSRFGSIGNGPEAIKINYEWKTAGNSGTGSLDAYDVFWQPELPEQSLLGFSADGNVNEGSIYAFADPVELIPASGGTFRPATSSKIWLFWTSTRSGTTDLFWETLSPEFVAR